MEELLGDILTKAIELGKIQVSFSGIDCTAAEVIEGQCFQAIKKIKAIVDDETLNDPECFHRIEKIVCALEELGSNGGSRHDFG